MSKWVELHLNTNVTYVMRNAHLAIGDEKNCITTYRVVRRDMKRNKLWVVALDV